MIDQLEGQVSMFDPGSQSGRMFPEHSVQVKEKTSKQSSKLSAKSPIQTFQFLSLRAGGASPDASWERVTEVNDKKYKPCKDRDALRKWFEGLRTDSAEYKAYGNSLAIPCSYDVIRRVANAIRKGE